ncbi:MAG: tetratricopeptide repeat protein [Pseudomonadota bacterium]
MSEKNANTTLSPAAQQHLAQGQAALAAHNLVTALEAFQQAAALAPDSEPVLAALGQLAMEAADWVAAERILRRADTLYAGRHRARLALAIFNQQRYADALPLLEQIGADGNIDENCALAWSRCLEKCGQQDRSVRLMTQIYQGTKSERNAVLLMSVLLRLGRRRELDEWMPKLLADWPQNAQLLAGRSEHGFLSGDYATGFEYMHHRWALSLEKPKGAQLPCPAWDGRRFDGTLLVTAEQGLGDQVLASSVYEELVRIGQPALIDCDARLLPLYRRSFPSLQFADRKSDALERAARDPAARKIDGLELGRYFRRDIDRMPERISWLVADPQQVAHWRDWLATNFPGRRAIGVSWRSARALLGDSKSIPVTDLAPLLSHDDFVCVSLQYGDIAPDLSQLGAAGLVLQVAPGLDCTEDIDGLCALIAALDAVVTCSNTTAHLAGGLGSPTRVMIPGSRYVLWYWGHDGERAPWYRSLRLFRGPPRRDWRALAGDVAADLTRTLAIRP